MNGHRPAVLLDRDGALIEDRGGFCAPPDGRWQVSYALLSRREL